MILRAYGPVDFKKKKKRILSRERTRLRLETEKVLEDQERWDWLKKKTKDTLPIPYAFSTPMSKGEVIR